MKKVIQKLIILGLVVNLAGCGSAGTEAGGGSTAEVISTAETAAVVENTGAEGASAEAEPIQASEGKYPIHWDLSDFYESAEAWQEDYDSVMDMIDQYDSYVGTINNAQSIYDFLEFSRGGELSEKQSRLGEYASLAVSLNASDETARTMNNKLSVMYSEESQKTAFFENELLSIPYEERIEILNDPILEEYRYLLSDYFDEDRTAKSEETIRTEAILGMAAGAGENTADSILYLDVEDPEITLPDGTSIVMNDAEYSKIISNNEYSSDFKKEAQILRLTKVRPYINALTTTLESTMKEYYSYAQLEDYDTTRAFIMDQEDVDAEVYDLLIDNVHEMLPDYQRYMSLHADALGIEDQYSYDLGTSVSNFTRGVTSYDDAVDEVKDVLQIFGQDYIDYFDDIVGGGHVDVYPAGGKTTGGFMSPSQTTTLPYVLYNYGGSYSDVSTIAHEMGHALYASYAQNTQPVEYRNAGIFTQEVASTLNEIIFVNQKIDSASDVDEKLYYLEQEIDLINGTMFRQAMYAEFEDTAYQMVENGEALTADKLNALWMSEVDEYYGDAVNHVEEEKYYWACVPHFYYGYYVYKYATSITYATSLYSGIAGENSEDAVQAYKEFLKAGGSGEPRELLMIAGIDIHEEETYEKAREFYGSLVDEYERLLEEKENQ